MSKRLTYAQYRLMAVLNPDQVYPVVRLMEDIALDHDHLVAMVADRLVMVTQRAWGDAPLNLTDHALDAGDRVKMTSRGRSWTERDDWWRAMSVLAGAGRSGLTVPAARDLNLISGILPEMSQRGELEIQDLTTGEPVDDVRTLRAAYAGRASHVRLVATNLLRAMMAPEI